MDFLTFRKMFTPVIIQVIFWIGVAACVIGGLILIVAGVGARFGTGAQVLGGFLLVFLGPLVVRIHCELLIVFFRILDELGKLREDLADTGGASE